MTANEKIQHLVENPSEMIKKKPFTRGMTSIVDGRGVDSAYVGEMVSAVLPDYELKVVEQSTFRKELDPACHKVLYDDNIPSITAKTNDGHYYEIEFKKMAVPMQKMIVKKHVERLCGYPTQFTLDIDSPADGEIKDFALYKRMWKQRNIDGMRTRMVEAQKSYGDAGLLFYFDRNGHTKCRLISYEDGYVICSHNDENGDRLMECVYYQANKREYIDAYTDTTHYRFTKDIESAEQKEWVLESKQEHGFPEIPLVTKRGDVAWNDVQDTIEVYEIIYNIFLVIQKRHGWGVLYIKGNFSEKAKKIAGAVVLNDSSLNKDGSAQYLTPPSPQGMLDTLNLMEETIQKGSGVTFILPKDIKQGGDISGVAIQLTQSLDNEEALLGVIDWQNVISKMSRLAQFGFGKELVNSDTDSTAVTRLSALPISAFLRIWRPRNDTEYNQMLVQMKGGGILSQKTAVEKNTESTPDEELRVLAEAEAARAREEEVLAQQQALQTENKNSEEEA